MEYRNSRYIKLISTVLIVSMITGIIPWRELHADANTHGEYNAYPFDITYEQNSTWNNSTQGTIELTNTSGYSVTSWSLEIDYLEDVALSNIWNVTGSTSNGNVIVEGSSEIEPGQTFTFGLVVDGEESNPVAPVDINTIQFISDEPEVTPTPEPTPEITDEPTNTPSVTEEPTVTPSVTEEPSETPTPTEEPTQTPTPTATETPTPTPTDIPEEEQNIFPYAIFSGSATNDFTFQGWRSNITGDVYSGRDFLYQGSELYMEGYARTVGVVNPSGWITSMTGAYEGVDPIEMPDWSESILAKEDLMPSIDLVQIASAHSIYANGYLYVDGDITIDSAYFSGTGDIVIVANGNITYNVDTINSNIEEDDLSGRILLYSEEGNITINGNEIEVNGILYAPNGRVSINAYNTTINGRIVADRFSYSGSILNVTADPSDLELVNELPQVDVTASSVEVNVNDYAYYTIEIPEDNVFEIRYRLNGEEVFVQPPETEGELSVYNLNTSVVGVYTLEAYVILPYGEFVLDSDTITVIATPTPTEAPTPTEEPTESPTPEPTDTSTPTPTDTPTETPTPTEEPTITDTPTPTDVPSPTPTADPMPSDFPVYSDVVYTGVMSQGDTRYGYETEFIEEDWNIHDNTTYSPTIIRLTDGGTYRNGYSFYNHSQHIDEDFSFSLRYTYQIDLQRDPSSDGIAFVMQTGDRNTNSMGSIGQNIGYQGLNPSIEIESDIYRNGGEINNHHIAVVLNANSGHHEAVADYPLLRDNNAIQNMWIDYDGFNDMLYVYAATYNGYSIEKPAEPLIAYNVDISELFGETEDIYMGLTSASGGYMGRCSVIGMEYGTIEFEEPVIGIATNIYRVIKGDPIEGDGVIHGSDSYVQLIDSDENVVYSSDLNPTGEYERLFTIDTSNIDEGVYTLIVTATDGEGETITKELPVLIYTEETPTETPTPTQIPDEDLFVDIEDSQDGEQIPFFTDIVGTVSGSDLQYYTFEVYPVDSDEAVYSSTGSGETVEGNLGRIDPTLLMNGYYRVIVTGYGVNESLSDEIIVLVCGQAKVGNFTLSFLDMSLPVAGLPVEVYRTYDSRIRTQNGDYGYGWDLSIGGPSISISDNFGEDWATEQRTVLGTPMYYWHEIHPHEVYIDWGNGHEEVFEIVLTPERTVSSNNWVGISASTHNSSGGNDTLQILDEHDGLIYADNCLYRSSDFGLFEPQNFLLTRYDGIKFYFNADTGLYKIEDTYGRTIEITEDGILYSDGSSIDFVRNADGQITSIEDGLGNEVIYTYNENGDLISVVDTAGYTTTFTYDDSHYITDITADNGVRIARNEYDEDGRLVATIDADGRRLEFDHDLNDRTEVTTDRLGYNTIYVYDERGNVTSVTDALGRTITYTYDDRGNKTSETRPDGTTFTYSYDHDGNLLTANDGNGRTINSSYGTNGELLTMSAMGVTELTMAYDEHGNLLSATDSSGNTQNYGYDNTGNLTSVTDSLGSLMNMTYDSNGHVTSITNAEGQVTNFSYDNEGRLVSRTITYQGQTLTDTYSYDEANRVTGITYANGNTVSYTYNQAGDVTSSTDSQGRIVNYTYDVYGNLTRIDYPDGTHESFTYDAEGRNLTATDRMGRTATFTYDAVGNCTSKTYANGAEESYTYDSCDRIISSTNVYGGVTTYGYDYLGRNTSVQDPQGNTTTYTYNDRGNVASVTDARGFTYTFTYDNNGNQTSVTYPNGSTFSNTYDARGRMTSQSDAYGNTTTYSYDDMDRLVSVTDALNGTWTYAYDSMGNVTSVTDANGNITTYAYDIYGQVISVTNAAGNTATTTYDQYGRVTSTSDFGGTVTEYTYDSMDRVATATTSGETTSYTYDAVGNLVSVEDPAGTMTYSYNADGYLSSVTNARGESISYSYNEGGQVESISIDGQTISYGYDNMGRLISVTDSEGTTSYTYDAVGNRISTTYPNGVVTTYGYNSINVLVSEVATDSDDNILASYEYTIGANGERLSCTELGRTVEYTYDALERLTSETVTVGSEVSVTTYTYDSNSNRLSMTRDGEVTNYTYNSLNQITQAGDVSYTWDNAGNLVSQSRNGVIAATYTYDCHNRMISANVNNISGNIDESYTYDYLGNRTSKTTNGETTYFTTDLSTGYSQVLKAENSSETIYYTRGFELISRRVGTDAHYYLFDGGMSVRGLTDESGVLTDTFVFDAFGNEIARTGTTDNSYGFQGEEQDATGLYYLRARYMDPSTGTFTSMDTYAGSLSDPMSLHKYLFANSNPVKYCDPSGHFSEEEMVLAMGLQAIIGAELDGIFYILNIFCGDEPEPYNNRDFFLNLIIHMHEGALFSLLFGCLALIASLFWITRVILLVCLVIGGLEVWERASDDLWSGVSSRQQRGLLELGLGLIMIVSGLQGLGDDIFSFVDICTSDSITPDIIGTDPYDYVYESSVGNGRSRGAHRNAANRSFYDELMNNARFRNEMNDYFGYDVAEYMSSGRRTLRNPSSDYVWHHPVDNSNVVRLVSRNDHVNPELQSVLHPRRVGGYHLYYGGS